MDTLLFFANMLSPMPKVTVGPVYTPPPQAPREAPFNWTPIILTVAVAAVGYALIKKTAPSRK